KATDAGGRAIAYKLANLLGRNASDLLAAYVPGMGWAGWRAAISDHLPVIAPADSEESLWVNCAYGSRGLSWMTLAGEMLAAKLNFEPQVIERDLCRVLGLR